jgi:glycosyltransferase involved in cell wall biosynthesis
MRMAFHERDPQRHSVFLRFDPCDRARLEAAPAAALPACHGLAGAFGHAGTSEQWRLLVDEAMASGLPVLVSERCGCAHDLVKGGSNGFTFDPYDVDELAGLMQRVAAMTDERRRAMGRASQTIVADWGPDRFANGLMRAVEAAASRPPPKSALLDQALLWALARGPL